MSVQANASHIQGRFVSDQAPADGQPLVYEASSSSFKPKAVAAGSIPDLSATYQAVAGQNTPGANGYSQLVATPATATSTGVAGQIAYDATHIYVCVAANTWVRASLATF